MTSLRELAGFKSYGDVVREERFFCAVLFHLLLSCERALEAFLKLCRVETDGLDLGKVRVYVEYAMARDLWHTLEESAEPNENKKKFIQAYVPLLSEKANILEIGTFNERIVAGPVSCKHIQSPGRWDLKEIYKLLKSVEPNNICDEEFRMACRLKWAFNVKPDMVIEVDENRVVCIEAKMESGEANYSIDALPDDAKGKFTANQTEIQKFLMTDILGFEKDKFHQVFLSKSNKGKQGEPVFLTWAEVFDKVLEAIPGDTAIMVELARKRIGELTTPGKSK